MTDHVRNHVRQRIPQLPVNLFVHELCTHCTLPQTKVYYIHFRPEGACELVTLNHDRGSRPRRAEAAGARARDCWCRYHRSPLSLTVAARLTCRRAIRRSSKPNRPYAWLQRVCSHRTRHAKLDGNTHHARRKTNVWRETRRQDLFGCEGDTTWYHERAQLFPQANLPPIQSHTCRPEPLLSLLLGEDKAAIRVTDGCLDDLGARDSTHDGGAAQSSSCLRL